MNTSHKILMAFIFLLGVDFFTPAAMPMALASADRNASDPVAIDGDLFQRHVMVNGISLVLKGTALLRYLVFIKAYTGALYLPDDADSAEVLSNIPKHLVLDYRVAIQGPDFAEATAECIRKATTEAGYAALRSRIELLNSWYLDVKPGDRYAISYVPGIGTTLALNGSALGTLPGEDFQRALFGVWLGEKPIDTAFRDSLLGANP